MLKRKLYFLIVPLLVLVLGATETVHSQDLVNPDFSSGLSGWTVSENGGSGAPGSVSPVTGQAEFLEGDSFLVTLQQGFTVADIPDSLSFDLIPTPGFDQTAQFIPDAFEVSLLHQNSTSAVPTWKPGASSFFNIQENGMVHLGLGTTFNGTTVTVDISSVPPQAEVILLFDFIGGDKDTNGGVRIDGVVVQNINTPPDCTNASADPHLLWPPNHKFRTVSVLGITDPDDDAVSVEVTSVHQDEPLNTISDGNTLPDAELNGDDTVELRAERAGSKKVPGNGRVYHVGFTGEDEFGEQCAGTVLVCVPHDKGNQSECIDDGPLFDSL